MSSDLAHWHIDATVVGDTVEEIHYISDPTRNIRRQQQRRTWQSERLLGRGGFGEVRVQTSSEDGTSKVRAVKRISTGSNNLQVSECEKELEALLEFSKPKHRDAAVFVEFYGWFKHEFDIFLAMEFIALGDLEKNVLACSGKVPEREASDIASQILLGLKYMHEMKFAHRDLKPQNVLVCHGPPDWWVKLADFGLSKRLTDNTALNTRSGTEAYMAPEMHHYMSAVSTSSYTHAVDLWATGCIIYRVITGVVPFPRGPSLMRYCEDKSLFPFYELIDSGVKSEVVKLLRLLLDVNPQARPTASEVLQHPWILSASSAKEGVTQLARLSEGQEENPLSHLDLTVSEVDNYKTVTHAGLKTSSSSTFMAIPQKASLDRLLPSAKLTECSNDKTIVPQHLPEVPEVAPVVRNYGNPVNFESANATAHHGRSHSQKALPDKTSINVSRNEKKGELNDGKVSFIQKFISSSSRSAMNKKLLIASSEGDEEAVKELFEKGASIETVNKKGEGPLHLAAYGGHTAVVRILLDKGSSTESKTKKEGKTPLHQASIFGHTATILALLEYGAQTEARDVCRQTALHYAVKKSEYLESVMALIEHGADVKSVDVKKSTPLHYAAVNGNDVMVRVLLEKGTNINAIDKLMWTPLHHASNYGHVSVVRTLLEKGADPLARTFWGATPLALGNDEMVRLLFEATLNREEIEQAAKLKDLSARTYSTGFERSIG